MRIFSFAFLLSIFISSISQAEFVTHTLKRADGSDIHYYLDQQTKPSPLLLVIMQGSDCNSVKNNVFIQQTFGQLFPDSDKLMVEKYGITEQLPYQNTDNERSDCPKTYTLNDNPSQRTADYMAVLDKLSAYYPKIVLIGGSEGATMVHLITAKRQDIHAAIALNGGGQFFIDDVIYSIKHTTPPAQINEAVEGFQQFVDAIQKGEIDATQDIGEHNSQWWKQFLSIDVQAEILKNTKTPVLIVQTLNDINVDVSAFEEMKANLQRPNVQFLSYDHLDHGFYDQNKQRHTDEIISDIQKWYKQYVQ